MLEVYTILNAKGNTKTDPTAKAFQKIYRKE